MCNVRLTLSLSISLSASVCPGSVSVSVCLSVSVSLLLSHPLPFLRYPVFQKLPAATLKVLPYSTQSQQAELQVDGIHVYAS